MLGFARNSNWAIASVLALAIPLCCCEGQRLVISLASGLHRLVDFTANTHGHDAPGHAEQEHTGGLGHHGDTHSADSERTTDGSCGDEPCDDDRDCDCGHANLLASMPSAPDATPPASTVAAAFVHLPVDWLTPVALATPRAQPDAAHVPRQSTSLLRLHCALIV